MTHPAVDAVLDFIKDNWQAGSYSDIPLERIDRDNSKLLDGAIRSHSAELEADNYVGATLADRDPSAIGTEYDHQLEVVVGVRIEGLHADKYGKVDPDASLPPNTANDPVPWFEYVDGNNNEQPGLVKEVRDAILRDRTFPSTRQADIAYTDLQITNESDSSDDHRDFFRHDFDVVFSGFEELP